MSVEFPVKTSSPSNALWSRYLQVQCEIDRVRLAIHKTKSSKLQRDYTKYLRKLCRQRESLKDACANSSEITVKEA